VNQQDIVDIAQLIYNRWSEAASLLDHAKKETDDGSPDWQEFHEYRVESAKAEEWKWNDLKNRYNDQHRTTINKAFGI
jgi:hypothetical protein